MDKSTKTILIVGGLIALGIGAYFIMKKDDVKGEGEVSAEAKKANKIVFTRE
jgi:hypothetical protein